MAILPIHKDVYTYVARTRCSRRVCACTRGVDRPTYTSELNRHPARRRTSLCTQSTYIKRVGTNSNPRCSTSAYLTRRRKIRNTILGLLLLLITLTLRAKVPLVYIGRRGSRYSKTCHVTPHCNLSAIWAAVSCANEPLHACCIVGLIIMKLLLFTPSITILIPYTRACHLFLAKIL